MTDFTDWTILPEIEYSTSTKNKETKWEIWHGKWKSGLLPGVWGKIQVALTRDKPNYQTTLFISSKGIIKMKKFPVKISVEMYGDRKKLFTFSGSHDGYDVIGKAKLKKQRKKGAKAHANQPRISAKYKCTTTYDFGKLTLKKMPDI